MAQKVDVYQKVTDRVIEAMESGNMPWQKGWDNCGAEMQMPLRHNGQMYRGINVILLWFEAMAHGYKSPYWMTFKQAKEYGACVRKGEKGTQICYFNIIEKENPEKEEKDKIPFLRSFTVFNADQIDGLPEKFAPVAIEPVDNGTQADSALESFFANTGARILTEGNQPAYYPAFDYIKMPAIAQFKTSAEYYGTLAHEIVHWTGHNSRLDRGNFGKDKETYAFEELIAELGNLYVCSQIDVIPNFDNSAAYLNSWLKALRNDKKYIFKAATQAQKAADLIMELGNWESAQKAA